MAANTITVGELLGRLFPGSDIAAGLEKAQTVLETLAKKIFAGFEWVCEMADQLEKARPVPGYELMLIERGDHPLMARGLSYWLIRSAKEEANKAPTVRNVADALRFLAKPGRTQRSISRRAAALLEVWNATGTLGDAFQSSDISVFEFVEALEGAVRGEFAACRRVTEVAAALAPRLSIRRGPKASEASIAHQLLLQYLANSAGPKSYTYSQFEGDFTDPLTLATRSAFDKPRFDPRLAFRRHRARLQQKSK
jgi:hypothetical protein